MANASNLVIVESPSKAKTIGKYLGPDYVVKASMGHLRDLPKSVMGVDLESFDPRYIPVKGKESIISELKDAAKPYPTVISIVAGYPSSKIRTVLDNIHIVRVMPNTPLLLGCGATALCACQGTEQGELTDVEKLFAALGETYIIEEEKMNEIIAVNGSSPAFVYYFIEAIARWGESVGLSYEDCLRLCAKTFEGSAKMILKGDVPPAELIRRVCSPGGTTIAAMNVLESEQVAESIAKAADACTKRAIELGKM